PSRPPPPGPARLVPRSPPFRWLARSGYAGPARRGRGRLRSPSHQARRRPGRPGAVLPNVGGVPRAKQARRPAPCPPPATPPPLRRLPDRLRLRAARVRARPPIRGASDGARPRGARGPRRSLRPSRPGGARCGRESTRGGGVDPPRPGGGGQPPPGGPRAHAIGGLKGIQGATLAQLAAAEGDVHLA